MKIADLYIDIGTKGSDKTGQQLTSVRASLNDVKSMGLAAKAAIIGAIYELGNLSHQSMELGLALQQFGNLTGLDPEALQKWQFALQQSGVSADETRNSIVKLQSAMTDMALGKGPPEYFAAITRDVGVDPKRFRDTFYVFDKLREFARSHRNNPDITRNLLGPLVGNDKVLQALMTGTFNPANTPRSQMYNARERKALSADAVQLKNITTQWEHFLGKLTAEHGGGALTSIAEFSTSIIGLVNALDALGKSLHVFDGLSDASEVGTGFVKYLTSLVRPSSSALKKTKQLEAADLEKRHREFLRLHPHSIASHGAGNRSTTLNQTVNVHGAEKPAESGHAAKHEVGKAFRLLQTGQTN